VTYNDWRGEPRGRHAKKAAAQGLIQGDCVDCNACVAVCPMGIDIRDGQQLECITCALCIDACDTIMDKLDRPRGLISYATLADYADNMALATDPQTGTLDPRRVRTPGGGFVEGIRHFNWRIIFRPRSLLYMGVWSAVGIGLVVALLSRDRLEVNVLHDRNPQFVLESNGDIRNGYSVKILNMIAEPRVIFLSIEGLPGATMRIAGIDQPPGVSFAIPVEPDRLRELRVNILQPRELVTPKTATFRIIAEDKSSFERDSYVANFHAPEDM
ncbi:4Fe-4S dicluster domain-containing protein, partial [Hoeflea sp.]|uniref:4Fe-4S dicluster domain-containing protein n=1 Tax=Hoeflea sp. TaxID=1940281 RepID=UPI00198DF615